MQELEFQHIGIVHDAFILYKLNVSCILVAVTGKSISEISYSSIMYFSNKRRRNRVEICP